MTLKTLNETEMTSSELLNIGFGGAFSTDTVYTNATGETMDGTLLRRTGNEEIDVKRGVILTGDLTGIEFHPRASLGDETIDQALLIETTFKPEPNQKSFNTVISVGGALYVRYTSPANLEYGFAVNQNGNWTASKKSIKAPMANEDHTIALIYEPIENGAKLRMFLNDLELPSVISNNGKAGIVENTIGFGNDVHEAGLGRGVKGSISGIAARVFKGSIASISRINRSLLSFWGGSLKNGNYLPVEDELVQGKLEIHGGRISDFSINLDGHKSYMEYTPNIPIVDNGEITGNYIAEIVVASSTLKEGTVLINLAGVVILRRSIVAEAVDVIINNQIQSTIDITGKLADEYIHLTLLYQNVGDHQVDIRLRWGEEQLGETITLETRPKTDHTTVVFAGANMNITGESLAGKVYGIAFASLEGDFQVKYLGLRGSPSVILTNLKPGYRIPIQANERSASLAAKASLVRPQPKQITWQQYEQTAFFHYGINTYYGVEWGNFNEDPNMFQPTDLDTDQWARTLRDSGFKLAILTVKHHDGFVLYPTRYTDFSVASSTWREGKGNVLREFVDSMRKYGIKIGVYLSPADHGAYTAGVFANGSPRNERAIPTFVAGDDRAEDSSLAKFMLQATDYGEMLLNQLYEVLTEYGQIDEVWFDGAQGHIPGDKKENYDWDSYYELIYALQPQAVVAITGHDVRWVGNESGWAREDEWSVLATDIIDDGSQIYYPEFNSSDLGSRKALASAAREGMKELTWWPAEVDVSIRQGWFYHENQQPKSVEELRNIYYQSVAKNSVLLLNIPPDKRGKLADVDVERLKEWHQSIQRDFAINHAVNAVIRADGGAEGANPYVLLDGIYENSWQSSSTAPSSITFTMEQAVTIDKVVLQENIHHGQQVESFVIEIRNADGDWEEIMTAGVIGYKRIVVLPNEVTGKEFRVRFLQSRGPIHLSNIGLYQTRLD
ncbi:alpha-L-fucosidase [Lederbergia galactosidilytica]|uniref:alpha-L-fucosidase n=1 Tax=Lederbergia galactosidilytica TaxID=217031 RepID=UPI000B1C899D|nr:alpha-L-fucosidase [Lederbergia galactosidilytica]MBP1916221.1 alpha-L-fucosidase [Lederbergia galactosidilytica]